MDAYRMDQTHGNRGEQTMLSEGQFRRLEQLLLPGYLLAMKFAKDQGINLDGQAPVEVRLRDPIPSRSEVDPQTAIDNHEADYARQHERAALNPTEAPIRAIGGTQVSGFGLTNENSAQPGDVVTDIQPVAGVPPVSVTERVPTAAPDDPAETPPAAPDSVKDEDLPF